MKKVAFLKNEYVALLATIGPETQGIFGKMNVHQMIEHMGYAFRQASGVIPLEPTNDAEITEKMYRFMMSDKPFRDNTPNVYLPETPLPVTHSSITDALSQLQKDIDHFLFVFGEDNEKRILNPFFGNLNFDEWIHLLCKHASHHLRQFGVDPMRTADSLENKALNQ